ncbi:MULTISPECIES: DUF4229 domain-containing protein [Thermomonospora]|uniref:DUF4229 domain-containing protein n=1 Tax=Thermomonospora curvata (strain ATCC 19995 / DSM 43183 / JCM 3096 / KCTC 9072 / NBRC 15933 / NCIMB 10081 / Henssen B9) TaxID=471852 RepID=D1A475_THECD|nr:MULTISPECIES: DUF4229 domain-containing protein [Thermomonospora]ACY99949.1 hypothetical protein Tcur_4422 [Thermomonospora curvata DSM 43183]PKK12172.1 MAG: DUF4229 domain-containing protein [Thermomonospora sp. CIF 1]
MRSVLVYTAARLAVFAVTAGILYLVLPLDYADSASWMVLLAVAVLVSGIVSYVLLARQREAFSAVVVSGIEERRRRFEQSRAKED